MTNPIVKTLHFGCNRYPRNPLRWCHNGVKNFRAALATLGIECGPQWLDPDAYLFWHELGYAVEALAKADPAIPVLFIFQFSGHGSQIRTQDPRERDGWSETIVLSDGTQVPDFDLRAGLDKLEALDGKNGRPHVSTLALMDECHGATDTSRDYGDVPRFLPPPDGQVHPTRAPFAVAMCERPRVAVYSACRPNQTAIDAEHDFTYFMSRELVKGGRDMTHEDWITRGRLAVREAGYTQEPMAWTLPSNYDRPVIGSYD